MTVNDLMSAIMKEEGGKTILLALPTTKGRIIIKDIASVHTKAVEDAIIITAETVSKVQEDLVLCE